MCQKIWPRSYVLRRIDLGLKGGVERLGLDENGDLTVVPWVPRSSQKNNSAYTFRQGIQALNHRRPNVLLISSVGDVEVIQLPNTRKVNPFGYISRQTGEVSRNSFPLRWYCHPAAFSDLQVDFLLSIYTPYGVPPARL